MKREQLSEYVPALLARHKKVALQFSGGKDSMACLYLLEAWLDSMTVYWLNTGDAMPETEGIIEHVKTFVPNFVEVASDVKAYRAEHGLPSDLVPTYSTPLGRVMGFGDLKVVDRFSCCWSNVMRPMLERMRADGVTCIIRGTKAVDMPRLPARSGEVHGGVELFHPLEDWTHEEVLAYLREVEAPMHSCYEEGYQGVDCMGCTAWWNERHFDYLKKHHPDAFRVVAAGVRDIAAALEPSLIDLQRVADLTEGV